MTSVQELFVRMDGFVKNFLKGDDNVVWLFFRLGNICFIFII